MSVLVTVIIVVAVVVVLLVVLAFNGLVRKRNRTQEAWSQIDVELKRRHDLIPNLVETVKGYAAHERQTFEAVTNARAAAVSAGAPATRPRSHPQRTRCRRRCARCSSSPRTTRSSVRSRRSRSFRSS